MAAKKINSMLDSGYNSTLAFSSFSFNVNNKENCVSTPRKDEHLKISQKQNAKINFFSQSKATNGLKSFSADLGAHTQKSAFDKISVANVLLDCKTIVWIALILILTVFVIVYKMILVAMPYANQENFYEATTFLHELYSHSLEWANDNHLWEKLKPFFYGLAVSVSSFMIVYLDSHVPGSNPPLPFTLGSKASAQQQRFSKFSLSYLTAIAAGIAVSGIMWFES